MKKTVDPLIEYYENEIEILGWKHLLEIHEKNETEERGKSQWIYRGVPNSSWGLETSIERAIYQSSLRYNSNLSLSEKASILTEGLGSEKLQIYRFRKNCYIPPRQSG